MQRGRGSHGSHRRRDLERARKQRADRRRRGRDEGRPLSPDEWGSGLRADLRGRSSRSAPSRTRGRPARRARPGTAGMAVRRSPTPRTAIGSPSKLETAPCISRSSSPPHAPTPSVKRGSCLLDEAIRDQRKSVERDADYARDVLGFARFLCAEERFGAAREASNGALELRPGLSDVASDGVEFRRLSEPLPLNCGCVGNRFSGRTISRAVASSACGRRGPLLMPRGRSPDSTRWTTARTRASPARPGPDPPPGRGAAPRE